ncbi:MAG TPA: mandelate racemase/muconate lactonizing enzyme family protein [Pirellulales bacterium]|nr:mandelate racemase/muconate lactonizing enzyme family protein [Pirellulales bacterium]
MKITDVEALHLRIPHVEQIADGTQDVLVVRVTTEDGLVGIGEVSSQSYVAKAIIEAPPSAERRHGLRHIIVGQDATDVEALWQRMYFHTNRYGRRGVAIHAMSGVDIALWDLRGKALGVPIYALWGGARRPVMQAYASYLFGDTPEGTARLAAEARQLGLSAVKFGWGPFGAEAATDRRHVAAARDALGNDCQLMVDAGCKWDADTALERAKMLAEFNVGWLEEPLSQDDLAGYGRLCPQSPLPIAAGEGEVTRWGFAELIERGVQVVQPDVAICGGLTVCREVSIMCQAAGRRVVPHCFSTGINLAASLHWMAAFAGDLVEYCLRPSPLMRKLVRNLPALQDGRVRAPSGPGLGIELDEAIIEQYRVRDY